MLLILFVSWPHLIWVEMGTRILLFGSLKALNNSWSSPKNKDTKFAMWNTIFENSSWLQIPPQWGEHLGLDKSLSWKELVPEYSTIISHYSEKATVCPSLSFRALLCFVYYKGAWLHYSLFILLCVTNSFGNKNWFFYQQVYAWR